MRKLGMMIVYWCSLSCSILFEEYSTTTGISNLIVNAVSSVLVTCQECFPIWCRLFEIGALSFVYRPYHTSSLEVIYQNISWQITRVTFGRHRLLYQTRCCHSLQVFPVRSHPTTWKFNINHKLSCMYNFSIILLTAISGTGNYRKKAQTRHDKNLPMKPFKYRLHIGT